MLECAQASECATNAQHDHDDPKKNKTSHSPIHKDKQKEKRWEKEKKESRKRKKSERTKEKAKLADTHWAKVTLGKPLSPPLNVSDGPLAKSTSNATEVMPGKIRDMSIKPYSFFSTKSRLMS